MSDIGTLFEFSIDQEVLRKRLFPDQQRYSQIAWDEACKQFMTEHGWVERKGHSQVFSAHNLASSKKGLIRTHGSLDLFTGKVGENIPMDLFIVLAPLMDFVRFEAGSIITRPDQMIPVGIHVPRQIFPEAPVSLKAKKKQMRANVLLSSNGVIGACKYRIVIKDIRPDKDTIVAVNEFFHQILRGSSEVVLPYGPVPVRG